MTKITSPVSFLEFGSTNIRFGVYDKFKLNQRLFYEGKIDVTKNKTNLDKNFVVNIIRKAEKHIDHHLNELFLLLDSPSINSIDICIQKNFDNKLVTGKDIDLLVKEFENIVKTLNKDKEILHILKSNIFLDNKSINNISNISQEVYKVTIELKFIMINKKIFDEIKNLFSSQHISVPNIFCASYVKTLGLIDKLSISGNFAFIDIGFKKSSILIFNDKKLLYINNIRIGGDSVTKDISKILNLDYRHAEAEKLKFSKTNKIESNLENNSLVRSIINSRLEEIVELLFLDCPLIDSDLKNNKLKLYFTGNGSKVLNENLLSFGPEFNFISDMSIIVEEKMHCCNSAFAYSTNIENIQPLKSNRILENKGFFEKLFEFFSLK